MRRRSLHKSRSGTTVRVSGRAGGVILLVIGLILLGVAAIVWFNSGAVRVKGQAGVSPGTARTIFAAVPGGLGALLSLLGLVAVVRGGGGSDGDGQSD
ncbi:hypothetical protein KKD52_15400 [Myxococcota bacterium]|nr:hypothetical protein [Myxococcota bacterium]MBU1410776.1 hypothetical protein [Myxococcota bacterium]MBU1511737.1 hypothetical protein [Myxococcota bacterium]